jgi:hypothetical protein
VLVDVQPRSITARTREKRVRERFALMVDVDFSLLKNIPFNERHRLQFRTEFFNLFNHANFDFPERICTVTVTGAPCTGATFGRITAARDPRILQFALKYLF